jgi:hypothetical protein
MAFRSLSLAMETRMCARCYVDIAMKKEDHSRGASFRQSREAILSARPS